MAAICQCSTGSLPKGHTAEPCHAFTVHQLSRMLHYHCTMTPDVLLTEPLVCNDHCAGVFLLSQKVLWFTGVC
jgi:hypothetical protein